MDEEGMGNGLIHSQSECLRQNIEEVEEKEGQRRLIRDNEVIGREGRRKEM
jgi:hypothetical protein